MVEMFDQLQAQMLLLPESVQTWMRWLNIVFLLGVFFVKNHTTGGWALAAYSACFAVAFPIYYFTRNIDLLGAPHVMFWGPLLIYIFKIELKSSQFSLKSFYGSWIALLFLTISISLVFDLRAIYVEIVQ